MNNYSYLAIIEDVKDSVSRGRGPKINFVIAPLGMWLELSEKNLEKLMNDFGIANYKDLVGRECTITYETGQFNFFSERSIRSIVPYTEFIEADFTVSPINPD